MVLVAEKLITAEELLARPRDGVKRELLWGRINEMSPSGLRHGEIAFHLGYLISKHVRKKRLGRVYAAETGFILSRDPDLVRAPDVAFIRSENIPQEEVLGFAEFASDLAVEVLSPNDRFSQVEEKARCWLQHGSAEVWIIDPENCRVLIHHQGNLVRDLGKSDIIDGGDLLPELGLKVEDIFRH